METYRCNRNCGCMRCRYRGFMGPVVLMTVGVLFLIDNVGLHNLDFENHTWPVLLIVIGVMIMLRRTASTEGHVQPFYVAAPFPVAPGVPPVAPVEPVVTSSGAGSEVRHE